MGPARGGAALRLAGPVVVAGALLLAALAWLRSSESAAWFDCSPTDAPGAPSVSVAPGFHDEPVEVRVRSNGGGPLYATLDGSYPDPEHNQSSTFAVTEPIIVGDTRNTPLRFSQISTQLDRVALADGQLGATTWQRADPAMDRLTVLRVRGAEGAECVAVYGIGADVRRESIPTVHLATDADHLFDPATGIYVPGDLFAAHLAAAGATDEAWYFLPANYHQTGRAWERPAPDDLERRIVLHWFEPGGQLGYSNTVGLRIHGSSSRAFPQKSLRLYARNEHGERTFDHDFFGPDVPAGHRRLVLRNAGSDCVCWYDTRPKSHMADEFVHRIAAPLGIETMAATPVVVFVNGEYWGLHILRERYDQHYFELVHGIPPDDVVIIDQRGDVDVGRPGDEEPLRELLELVESWPSDRPGLREAVEQLVDLDDFVTYLAVELYAANADWPRNNVKMWRERVDPDRPVANSSVRDGRWRWLLFDVDGLGDWAYAPDADRLELLLTPPDSDEARRPTRSLTFQLWRFDWFRHALANAVADGLNSALSTDQALVALRELDRVMGPERDEHLARWFSAPDAPSETARFAVDELVHFVHERPGHLRSHMVRHLGATGTAELTLEVAGPGNGVRVHRILVPSTTPAEPWKGTYFRGCRCVSRPSPPRDSGSSVGRARRQR